MLGCGRVPSLMARNSSKPDISCRFMSSCAGQSGDDRHHLLHGVVEDDVVRESVSVPAQAHLVDDVIDWPDEDRRHLQHLLGGYSLPRSLTREPLSRLPPLLGEDDRHDHAQLDLAEALPRDLTHLLHLLADGRGQAAAWST